MSGRPQVVRRQRRAQRRRPHGQPRQCVVLIGASGSGKSTLLRCANLLETVDDGVITFEGERHHRPAGRRRRGAVADGSGLPVLQPVPAPDVIGNVTLALRKVHGVAAAEAEQRGLAMLDRVGLAEKAQGAARRPVRRPAAARRDRPRARRQSATDAARRGDLRARPRARRRGARPALRPQGRGRDDGPQHPRDGLRPRGRRHRVLPARRSSSTSPARRRR